MTCPPKTSGTSAGRITNSASSTRPTLWGSSVKRRPRRTLARPKPATRKASPPSPAARLDHSDQSRSIAPSSSPTNTNASSGDGTREDVLARAPALDQVRQPGVAEAPLVGLEVLVHPVRFRLPGRPPAAARTLRRWRILSSAPANGSPTRSRRASRSRTARRSRPPRRTGRPSVRFVLVRGIDDHGARFFTNYGSRKGRELDANPVAALALWWPSLQRQLRLEGPVERLTAEESDAYFASRGRGSQLGAWASRQGSVIEGREGLEARAAELDAEFGETVPRPEWWGGLRAAPGDRRVLGGPPEPPPRPRALRARARRRLALRAAQPLSIAAASTSAAWIASTCSLSRPNRSRAASRSSGGSASSAARSSHSCPPPAPRPPRPRRRGP